MKLAITQHGVTYTLEVDEDDLTLSAVVEGLVRPALRALGYLDKSIAQTIGDVDEDGLTSFMEAVEYA